MTEAWGRGIEKIINSNVAAGKPKPMLEIIGSGLRVTFYTEDSFGINLGLNETQKKIVALMATTPEITAEQLSESVGISKRQVEANVSKLKSLEVVERTGARKSGWWVIKLDYYSLNIPALMSRPDIWILPTFPFSMTSYVAKNSDTGLYSTIGR